ncbi:Myrcene synthase, chloroplastic, putative [Theobroma cacao]|uniref:(+)-delta-cadinene synthase n=1 Tax=Theobroma cacao TaxID=3641 RepID=A0A061G5X5_THECC|nr:Myrcene synthase, chloroplastic, putative [Theobroma cacao]
MSFPLLAPAPSCNFITTHCHSISNKSNVKRSIVVQARKFVATAQGFDQKIDRRSANYHLSIWKDNYIQSLKSECLGKSCYERANKLVGEVRMMLDKEINPLEQLELIDTLQRLGLSYHFENEIKTILDSVSADHIDVAWKKDNLYATAIEFRLLRQHGYKVTQEVFSTFTDEKGNFKASLCEDCKGLLNLYEASYHLVEGENMLEKARDFAAKRLKEYLKQNKDPYLSLLVEHALELPLHWRMPRFEARFFIDVYEGREDRNPILLELAKLDFNMVQAAHQDDLKYASKWWRDLGIGKKLTFARDRSMENFLWTVGEASDPQFGYFRRIETKINTFIATIDDVYDVYGTLDELELFTEAVDRWDTNAMQLLPEYMQICFLALYNFVNEMAFDVLKDKGFDTIPFLTKAWADMCKSFLLEAKWYYSGYTPTLREYIDNAWISVTAPVILSHAYVLTNLKTNECFESFEEYSNIIYCSSIIFRLANDLATSSDELKRGDVPKSIQCYMHETGASEEEARRHIWKLIDATWRRMNEEQIVGSRFPRPFIQIAVNLARTAQFMYQHHDGYGVEDGETKERVLSLFVNPIPLR